ncbi:MAG: hypothetical protein H6806_03260 [Planctomycetes bacterium]|nr:hypothetical protein [Planctomycetota bacterium]MCB9825290.1 hypothetical protein [Planctomycetota bacterium]MCB9828773.1 hypothetical protein [Planctomycetota bacterium]MCB9900776.1 hypothetical protein [Planctomycetota bacterium]
MSRAPAHDHEVPGQPMPSGGAVQDDLRLARALRWGGVGLYALVAVVAVALPAMTRAAQRAPVLREGGLPIALYALGLCATLARTRPKPGHAAGYRNTLAVLVWSHAGLGAAVIPLLFGLAADGGGSAFRTGTPWLELGAVLLGVPAAVALLFVAERSRPYAAVSIGMLIYAVALALLP